MPPVMPVNLQDVILSIFVGLVVLIPVVGVTARIVLKPIVEAIARLREAQGTGQAVQMIERRMDLLEQEVRSIGGLREDVARLVEAQEFQLKLIAPEPTRQRTAD